MAVNKILFNLIKEKSFSLLQHLLCLKPESQKSPYMKSYRFLNLIIIAALTLAMVTGCKKEKDEPETVSDADGNIYTAVAIGQQVWLRENLKTTSYSNGDPVPQVTDETEWLNLNDGAYCSYDNNPASAITYGMLYNWFAATDQRNLCPDGWHVPDYNDWTTLIDFLGGEAVAGGKLKEDGIVHWKAPNTGATDSYSFTALPAGFRLGGAFSEPGYYAVLWSSSEADTDDGWILDILSSSEKASLEHAYKQDGFSIRCIKD
jgi:uncharacterized protein (TIGR02145 family)